MLALVKPECLLIEIGFKVRGVNADISTFERPFQKAPEILDVVRVHSTIHEFDGVIDRLVIIDVRKTEIGFERIGIDGCAWLDCCADFGSQRAALYVGNMRSLDATGLPFGSAFNNAKDCSLTGTASPLDLSLADVPMHVLGESTNERFIGFNLAAHLQKRAGLHCKPDAVIHEPCCFLSDTERPVHLIATDPFLQLATIQIAANHFPRSIGLSSKMVPTLAENWRRGCFSLHSHTRRVAMKRTSALPHVGQQTPLGQRSPIIVHSVTSGSAKYRMASIRV